MANRYGVGDLIRCTGTWTDSAGTNTDPDAITMSYKTPSGTTTTYTYGTDAELVNSATGVYYVDVNVTEEGRWWYQFKSTGDGQAVDENYFLVKSNMV